MRFSEVIKSSVREFSMQFLVSAELKRRGDNISMTSTCGYSGKSLMAVFKTDMKRRSFVSSCYNTNQGTSILTERWRVVDGQKTKEQFDKYVRGFVGKYY